MSNKKATVISPTALDGGQLERIGKVISKITEEDIMVENQVNEKMLGGIKVKFGTKEIDLSLEYILQKIKDEIDE